jgi:hypothetical protein
MNKQKIVAVLATALPLCCLALTSCEAEDSIDPTPDSFLQREAAYPDNPANPYDAAGQLYNAITESYIYSGTSVTTAADAINITEVIANNNTEYLALKPGNYVSPTASRIEYIASHGETAAFEVLSSVGLTIKAQLSLSTFIDTLMDYDATTDYSVIYDYIIKYETGVLTDPMLTSYDQRVMLTTSSVARHGFYLKKKKRPRDRDWDISWGNITGGMEGSGEDTAKAVVMAVSSGMLINR